MTRTRFYTATTLDGFIADENHSLAWLFKQPQDEGGEQDYGEFIKGIGALCMGSTTYEWVLEHEPDWQLAAPAWVFTHRDLRDDRRDVRFVSGPVEPIHAEMAAVAGDQDIWVIGGGDLAGQFADAGMLDRLELSIAPVTLGAGAPLLPRRLDLELVSFGRNGAFLCATYDVVGPLTQSGA